MDQHRTVLGALFLALGLMGLIGMTIVFAIFFFGSAVLGIAAANEPDVPAALTLLPVGFAVFICLAIGVQAIPSLIAAYGLLARRSWGRAWALIAGILNLPSLPFGTGVGVYSIWYFVTTGQAATPPTQPLPTPGHDPQERAD